MTPKKPVDPRVQEWINRIATYLVLLLAVGVVVSGIETLGFNIGPASYFHLRDVTFFEACGFNLLLGLVLAVALAFKETKDK